MVNVEGSLSADLIAQQNFGAARRGFDPDEVRAFLVKVAAEIMSLHERQSALEAARRDAEYRAAHPSFDEETLLGAVGDETAQILKSAHEAAGDIKSRAEENASRILKEAHQKGEALRLEAETVLARRTEEAEAIAGRIKETSRAEGERLVDQARQQSKAIRAQAEAERNAMIEGAQATRDRILTALSRKRNVAVAQVEQLRAGRERLLEAYQLVRSTLDQVTSELTRAETEARAAADAVRHRPLALDEPDGLADDGEPTNPNLPIVQRRVRPSAPDPVPSPVAPKAPPKAVAPGDARPEPGAARFVAGGEPLWAGAATGGTAGGRSPEAGPPKVGPAGGGSPEAGAPNVVAEGAGAGPLKAGPAKVGPAGGGSPEAGAPKVVAEGGGTGAPKGVAGGGGTPGVAAPKAVAREARAQGAVTTPAAPRPEAPAPTEARGTPDAVAPQEAEAPRSAALNAGPSSEVAPAAGPSRQAAAEAGPSLQAAASPGEPGAPENGGAPPEGEDHDAAKLGNPASVDSLFARIRADRDREVVHAHQVLAQDRPLPDADEVLLQRRDQALEPIEAGLTRRLKRALQDDQNDLLDRLRGLRPSQKAAAVVLPRPDAHAARFHDAGRPFLAEAAAAASALISHLVPGTRPSEHPASLDRAADDLAEAIVEPLRRRLEAVLEAGEGDDPIVLAEAVGGAYREWKTKRVELVAADQVAAVFAASAYAATPPGTPLRWLVEDVDGPCADCDDNALAGDQPKGEPFPTGQRHPPAHPGCRCLLVPRVV